MKSLLEGKISADSRVVFVNDGSRMKPGISSVSFIRRILFFRESNSSRNRGHQNALIAGLYDSQADSDMAISMDADLQDDINAMDEMVDKYLGGIDIVYGVRLQQSKGYFFKKFNGRELSIR